MDPLAEQYRTIVRHAGWCGVRGRGRLRFTGPDAASFLHALLTNDVLSLADGQGTYALWLTPQGRMIADLRIHRIGDAFLVDTPPERATALADRFDQSIFAERVQVSDVSGEVDQMSVAGPESAAVLARAFSIDEDRLAALPVRRHAVSSIDQALVARADDARVDSFDVFVPRVSFESATERLTKAGAIAMNASLADVLRLEAWRPAFLVDMNEDTIPLEAGLLERAISQTKGCYVGQEVIVRVLHRGGGRVAKRLVGLELADDRTQPLAHGTTVLTDGRDTGRVTSSVYSFGAGRVIALAYLHRDDAVVGRDVVVKSTGADRPARVVSLAG